MEKGEKGNEVIIKKYHSGGGTGAIYGFGVIGALVYFFQGTHTLMEVVLAIIKSVAWPALVVYKVLELLKF